MFAALLLAGLAGLVRTAAAAQATSAAPVLDPRQAQGGEPALPAALRVAPDRKSPSGAALRALVDQKMRTNFEAADTSGKGRVSREQARRSGWGWLDQQFEAIDARGDGEVTFGDIQRHIEAQRRK